MTVDHRSDGLVHSTRWRAMLARSQDPRSRLDLVAAHPHAAVLVPMIAVEDFYYLVRSVGLPDAHEVLGLASAEQLQGCLDLDIWEGDRLSTGRLLAWLEALTELRPEALAALMRLLDAELASLVIGRSVRIYDRSVPEAPARETRYPLYETPDQAFLVEFRSPDPHTARTLERFLDRIYAVDPDVARSLLTHAKWGTSAELEEASYRWRTARLADLGFPSYDEALAVYQYVDPRRPPAPTDGQRSHDPTDAPTLPVPFADALADESFLGRVLAEVDDPGRLADLSTAIVGLLNSVLVADRVDAGDLDVVRELSGRVRDTLSLGLEHAAGGDVGRGGAILAHTGLVELFGIGFSLTVDLARRAKALDRPTDPDPTLDALLERRPMFARALDPSPRGGERPFRTVADVRTVEAYLAEVATRRRADPL
jgi:uncharacterized protein DUF6178